MLATFLKSIFSEPWLAVNRLGTFYALKRQLRSRNSKSSYVPREDSMLYVAASTQPYHISGYTIRTHEIICALRSAGTDVHVLTRPGYPWDRKDRLGDAQSDETMFGGIRYLHAREPSKWRPVLQYALQAAPVIAEIATRLKVAVIHAPSNHVNALPALLAARQCGIPFHYELRGLWELTRISRQPGYEGSQGYKQGLQLEELVAASADRLFVISEQLGHYVRENWGLGADMLPNCVDPKRILSADPLLIESDTIGYAGSLISYEGLDTLIDAVHLLVRAGTEVKVNIVGDGEARGQLEQQVTRLGLSDRIRFFGWVAPESAREILGRSALVCIPRKPFKVCGIVPPIKLVEAMALGKPVIVPNLPVFRDELGEMDDEAAVGWFFRAGDAEDLAQVIGRAFADRELLAIRGARAREYAVTKRRWMEFMGVCASA